MTERLDEERLEILRAWGTGLSVSGRDELRAAGKAIVMLVEEIDRLQADVWMAREASVQRARVATERAEPEAQPGPEPSPHPVVARAAAETAEMLALTLGERIARGRAPVEPAG